MRDDNLPRGGTTTDGAAPAALRVQQVARSLDCSTGTVYGLVASGQLRGVRVGRLLRVRPEDLARFLAGD